MKPALLVLDIQKRFFTLGDSYRISLENSLEYINAAIDLFREKGLPVICVQHIDDESGLVPGTEDFETPESLKILPSDVHIHKTYGNAFTKTELARTLQDMGVDTLIITGFCAEYCVLSTIRGAQDHDLVPIVLRGSLASGSSENIAFVERVNDIISYKALKKMLENI